MSGLADGARASESNAMDPNHSAYPTYLIMRTVAFILAVALVVWVMLEPVQ